MADDVSAVAVRGLQADACSGVMTAKAESRLELLFNSPPNAPMPTMLGSLLMALKRVNTTWLMKLLTWVDVSTAGTPALLLAESHTRQGF